MNVSTMILDAYRPLVNRLGITESDVIAFAEKNPYLKCEDETDRLLYYLISKYPHQMRELWPLTDGELGPYFYNMGYHFE